MLGNFGFGKRDNIGCIMIQVCVVRSLDIHDMKGTETLMFAIGILGAHDMRKILGVDDTGEIGVGRGLRDVIRERERCLV